MTLLGCPLISDEKVVAQSDKDSSWHHGRVARHQIRPGEVQGVPLFWLIESKIFVEVSQNLD